MYCEGLSGKNIVKSNLFFFCEMNSTRGASKMKNYEDKKSPVIPFALSSLLNKMCSYGE